MIPVHVISLRGSQSRRDLIRSQLEPLGITFRFFDAVDGRALSASELSNLAPKGGVHYSGMLTTRELACALSHLAVIDKIAESEADYAAVFEDDISVFPSLVKFLDEQFLRTLPIFDILQLGPENFRSARMELRVGQVDGHQFWALPTPRHFSMYSLIYTREAARRIVAAQSKVTAPIDNMIFKDARALGLKIISLRPSVAKHQDLPSDIGGRPLVNGILNKAGRELRRFSSWCRRWRRFASAWGVQGLAGLRLRRSLRG